MTSLASFLEECLTEEKYGTTFVSEIDERLSTLNYIQLTRMQEVILKTIKASKMKLWHDGNEEILQHINKWLDIKRKQHEIERKQEEEILKRIQHKEKLKQLNEKEKIRVIKQLEEKAMMTAEVEIKHLEIQRKAFYKEKLFELVEKANQQRNKNICYGCLFLFVGCLLISFLIQSIVILLSILCGIICITLFIFYRAYRVSQVSPYDDNPETIQKKIQQRQEELFAESMEVIRRNEREYEEKMALDKMERKKRKQERRHREEVLRYLENHPEIPINPEEGDVDIQLKEYLLKNDPNQRSDEKKKTVQGIEIIHERSREGDEEEDDEKEGIEDKRSEIGASSAQPKEGDVHPETSARGISIRGLSSSKYLLGDNQEREAVSSNSLSSEPKMKLQLHLLTLTQLLSSFLDTKPAPDVYLTFHWKQNHEETTNGSEASQLLFKTDSQKCLGEVVLWRYEKSAHDNNPGLLLLPSVQFGSLSVELHSTRQSPSSDSLLASGTLPMSDLFLSSHQNAKRGSKSGGNNASIPQSLDLDLIRNDVVKVCRLSMEYHSVAPQ